MWFETAIGFATSTGMIVITAAALQAAAYLFSSQIMLRFFLLLGTGLYLLYYFVAAEDPLWPAILGTTCIGITSIYGFIRVLASRSKWTIKRAHMPIFENIGEIEPGAFRKLMKHAHIKTFQTRTPMTKLGVVPNYVYFTLLGDVEVSKNNHNFQIGPYNFIGEISIIGGFAATADTYSREGTTAVIWDRTHLLAQMKKDERFRIAVEALFAKDMAMKLAQAVKVN